MKQGREEISMKDHQQFKEEDGEMMVNRMRLFSLINSIYFLENGRMAIFTSIREKYSSISKMLIGLIFVMNLYM
jgi:hypothetical protein